MQRDPPKPLPPMPDPGVAKALARQAIRKAQESSRKPSKPVDGLTR